jgi:hypothetical protein
VGCGKAKDDFAVKTHGDYNRSAENHREELARNPARISKSERDSAAGKRFSESAIASQWAKMPARGASSKAAARARATILDTCEAIDDADLVAMMEIEDPY